MTRAYEGRVQCPNCGTVHTAETAFERWMRNEPRLDSKSAGIVRFDCDVLLHKYLFKEDKKGGRDLQCIMFIEVKTRGGVLRPAQQDTLSMLSQVLINRKRNIHGDKKGRHAVDHLPPARVKSLMFNRSVALRMFGGHLLELEADEPVSSAWIKWDYKIITADVLVSILRFEVDPHDPKRKMDWRRRYSDFETPQTEFEFVKDIGQVIKDQIGGRP